MDADDLEAADSPEMAVFEALRCPTSLVELERLARKIETHVDRIDEAELDNDLVDAELAQRLADTLLELARDAASLDAEGRSTLRGAIAYFVLTDDGADDVKSPNGLQDDARVVNRACKLLGRPDLTVQLV